MHLFRFSITTALIACCITSVAIAADTSATPRIARPTSAARMPTMPLLPINSIGNNADVITLPQPLPVPGDNGNGDTNPPPPPPEPEPQPECPDGGVKNSEYNIDACMNDILMCINNGALPNGLNNLFDEDVRNSIFAGMNLCVNQVEKCVTTVRVDCTPVYTGPADVWMDFNIRKVQPEYYNFVLRKTGLTPNQAENTCELLDRNTYGTAFSAVANDGTTTREYNITTGAFNGNQNDTLAKANPMGARVNTGHAGVDGMRGHYARWDAVNGECLIRVGAYNKDSQITNRWLFGAAGDDRMAEVWRATGTAFTCNKDLFGFSLMPKTNTTAVVGIGGGTLVGAGIGAIAGHGNRAFDCSNGSARRTLEEQLRKTNPAVLSEFIGSSVMGDLDEAQCQRIFNLYVLYQQAADVQKICSTSDSTIQVTVPVTDQVSVGDQVSETTTSIVFQISRDATTGQIRQQVQDSKKIDQDNIEYVVEYIDTYLPTVEKCNGQFINLNNSTLVGTGIYCNSTTGCQSFEDLKNQVARLTPIMKPLTVLQGEKTNILPSTLTGAAIGAGTGGVATLITSFVEKNNINCRVGDGLEQVGYGKSHSLGSLKDYYVKWNLRLPE